MGKCEGCHYCCKESRRICKEADKIQQWRDACDEAEKLKEKTNWIKGCSQRCKIPHQQEPATQQGVSSMTPHEWMLQNKKSLQHGQKIMYRANLYTVDCKDKNGYRVTVCYTLWDGHLSKLLLNFDHDIFTSGQIQ